jgi:putative tricarboxylic transport membrane protein
VRPYELATALVFVVLAGVAMVESRRGALIGATNDPGGIGSGFYPFWAAAFMGAAALAVMVRVATSPQPTQGVFGARESVVALLKLVVPMLIFTASLAWLGIYLGTALYMGFFARYIGRYRWHWVAAIALAFPLAIYWTFERGFRMSLPKSIWYGSLVPF